MSFVFCLGRFLALLIFKLILNLQHSLNNDKIERVDVRKVEEAI